VTDDVRISKTLSLWLRHDPAAGGLELDGAGWTEVDAVLAAFARKRLDCDWGRLLQVVETNDKQRFELSADTARIRARQGHSVEVDLGWPQAAPPERLFHGTVDRFLGAILAEGLKPMARHHVHLSPDLETARRVGARRGRPAILEIAAARLAGGGQAFYLAGNGVWLTAHVPPEFLTLIDDKRSQA
jgi:putative RNA 2'-phosphotransferase